MKSMKKSEKRVRFEDDVVVTGVIRKKSKSAETENPENFENFENPNKEYEVPLVRSCYIPEREKRVCPNFEPDLDFSIGWAKKFLKNIAM